MLRLERDYYTYEIESLKLEDLYLNLSSLSPKHQKLVAEIVLLRLFSLFENTIMSVASKVACETRYLDGSGPILLAKATSFLNSNTLFKSHEREKGIILRWTKGTDIINNVKYVISPKDNFRVVVDRNTFFIDEMRRVRNRIAHNSSNSRENFRVVVKRHYGAYRNNITPGSLLLSMRKSHQPLARYIGGSKILIKDLVKK
jgi:hypothetical protein